MLEAVSANLSETRVRTCAASRTGNRESGVRVDARPTSHVRSTPLETSDCARSNCFRVSSVAESTTISHAIIRAAITQRHCSLDRSEPNRRHGIHSRQHSVAAMIDLSTIDLSSYQRSNSFNKQLCHKNSDRSWNRRRVLSECFKSLEGTISN